MVSWTIWGHIVCCLTAPSHYLNQCWLFCQLCATFLYLFYLKIKIVHSRECILKWRLQNSGHFVSTSLSQSHRVPIRPGWCLYYWDKIAKHRLPAMDKISVTCKESHMLKPRWNGVHFADDIFKWFFMTKNVLCFDSNFTDVCSRGSNWKQVSSGSDNDLMLNRQQAITWSNIDHHELIVGVTSTWAIYPILSCLDNS